MYIANLEVTGIVSCLFTMGNSSSSRTNLIRPLSNGRKRFKIEIKTGEYKGADVSGKGDVCIRLWHFDGTDNLVSDTFKYNGRHFLKGSKYCVCANAPFDHIDQIEIWIHRADSDTKLDWFVDTITCINQDESDPGKRKRLFPVQQWVTMRHELISADASLPQFDRNSERRHEAIFLNNDFFYFSHFAGGIPTLTKVTLDSVEWSASYFLNVFLLPGLRNKIKQKLLPYFSRPLFGRTWTHIQEIDNIYGHGLRFPKPDCDVSVYMKALKDGRESPDNQFDQRELDIIFGAQRLIGTNPVVIRLVTEELIPYIEEAMKRPSSTTDDHSLDALFKDKSPYMKVPWKEAAKEGHLYMVDYTDILYDINAKTGITPSPIALFYVDPESKDLMPVAIQLFKKKHPDDGGKDNPIFTPDNDSFTWLLAKMWFNNADASYHESVSHLGFTHLLMETIDISLMRTVSISHPLYRLMAPHFRYTINVNSFAWQTLLAKSGWVNQGMNIGVQGLLQIIRRKFEGINDDNGEYIVPPWRLDVEGNIVKDVKNRGVDMKDKLPKYSFRDDALNLQRIIKDYVEATVDMAYSEKDDDGKPTGDKYLPWLRGDYEIQAWGKLMHDPVNEDHPELSGCGIKGLPYEGEINQKEKIYFNSFETLVDTITSIIYTCSVEHAAVNFHQYREYGFPLNYPAMLHGDPPRSKGGYDPNYVTPARSPTDILQALPTKQGTLVAMNITQVLSNYATVNKDDHNMLGHFPVQYQFTPDGDTPQNVKDFQEALKKLSGTMQERNARHEHSGEKIPSYEILDPEWIPNSISL